MYKFYELCIGDMFNTSSARWVKTAESQAICVMSAIHKLGELCNFAPNTEIILLWSCLLKTKD